MAIINNIDDIKLVFSAPNINNEFGFIQPYLSEAEELLLQFIGPAVFDLIQGYYDGNSEGKKRRLLLLSQKAIVHQAYNLLSYDGTMILDDTGFKRMKSEFSDSAFQWQLRDFRLARNKATYSSIEGVINHINDNLDQQYGAEWFASKEYDKIKNHLPWCHSVFSQYRSCQSLEVVVKLYPSILEIQQNTIANNIGQQMYDDLIYANKQNVFDDDQKMILPMVIDAVSNLATARAMDEEILQFGPDGIEIKEFKAGGSNDGSQSSKATNQIAVVKKAAEEKGQNAIKRLRIYLNKNASANKYTSYFNSSLYDDPNDSTDKSTFKNDPNSPTYFFG
jgi:hypothetical protein